MELSEVELRHTSCRGRQGWECSSIGISKNSVLALCGGSCLSVALQRAELSSARTGLLSLLCERFRLMLQTVANSSVSPGVSDTHSAPQLKYRGQAALGNVF